MAKKKSKKTRTEEPTFEQALANLEGIVHDLEQGELGLNEALARYEQGVKLLRQSYDLLEGAERRIELLSGVDAEGNPATQPFDDEATLPGASEGSRARQKTPRKKGFAETEPGKPRSDVTEMDAPGGLF